MDQNELRQWEQRCIQEEQPECTAACPIHVDVRLFISHVREGRFKEGWQVLARTMPLTGLLGRVCDAPCELRCKRRDAGDAIRVGALERTCIHLAREDYRVTRLPSKSKKIAVLGSSWSSLTAAWDLSRKGYAITLFESGDTPGVRLTVEHQGVISPEMVAEELAYLEKWGVCFESNTQIAAQAFLEEISDSFDAVYVGLDGIDALEWELARNSDGTLQIDPALRTTCHPKIFAGGDIASTIAKAAHGRFAATSIDRTLQKVSLTAGREKEGPYESRLFTSLKGITHQPSAVMADPDRGFSRDEAVAEAGRCILCECLECVKVCPFLETFGAYPRKYAREILNNESMFMGARTANTMINSCSLCGLCEAVCPENFAMQTLCLQTRQSMVKKGRMPPSAHEFALEEMAFNQSEAVFLARHAPGATQSSHLFFPGCQLCASAPGHVTALYEYLRQKIDGGVGLMLSCCGAPAHWAGRQVSFDDILSTLKKQWKQLGEPRLILGCSTCYSVFRDFWPQAQIQSIWEVLEEIGLPELKRSSPTVPLAIHDPCTTRDLPAVQAAVRRLASQLGVEISELPLAQARTECCGYGGLMQNANPAVAKEVIRRRAAQSACDYLSYCAMCRDSLASVGKRSLHLLDLIFGDTSKQDPATRPRPGWSLRRENRAQLKKTLLNTVWKEETLEQINYRRLELKISPEVWSALEERRILIEDLQQAIAHAEAGNAKLRHPVTGRLKTAFRPRHVTFWVEYAPTETGFEVFNAYAHRMEVKRQ